VERDRRFEQLKKILEVALKTGTGGHPAQHPHRCVRSVAVPPPDTLIKTPSPLSAAGDTDKIIAGYRQLGQHFMQGKSLAEQQAAKQARPAHPAPPGCAAPSRASARAWRRCPPPPILTGHVSSFPPY